MASQLDHLDLRPALWGEDVYIHPHSVLSASSGARENTLHPMNLCTCACAPVDDDSRLARRVTIAKLARAGTALVRNSTSCESRPIPWPSLLHNCLRANSRTTGRRTTGRRTHQRSRLVRPTPSLPPDQKPASDLPAALCSGQHTRTRCGLPRSWATAASSRRRFVTDQPTAPRERTDTAMHSHTPPRVPRRPTADTRCCRVVPLARAPSDTIARDRERASPCHRRPPARRVQPLVLTLSRFSSVLQGCSGMRSHGTRKLLAPRSIECACEDACTADQARACPRSQTPHLTGSGYCGGVPLEYGALR